MRLADKRILLGVSGGIAAYKSAELVRRLKDQGAEVRVVMTRSAKEFITPLTLQAVSGHPVADSLLDPAAEAGMGHIELAKWADLVLIAPASANLMARMAAGMADELLTTLCLATPATGRPGARHEPADVPQRRHPGQPQDPRQRGISCGGRIPAARPAAT
jgi:phosphopantothenoylcysteine decarboxylase/phosphopantothenate--cysteine ligase